MNKLDYQSMDMHELRARFAVRIGLFTWVYYDVNDQYFLFPTDRSLEPFKRVDEEWIDKWIESNRHRLADWMFCLYDSGLADNRFHRTSMSPLGRPRDRARWTNLGLIVESMTKLGLKSIVSVESEPYVAFTTKDRGSVYFEFDADVERAALIAALKALEDNPDLLKGGDSCSNE